MTNRQCVGYTPAQHQLDVHNFLADGPGSAKIAVVKAQRQCGKSLMCENQLLYYALNFQRTKNAMVSPTLSQSRKVFKDIVDAIGGSGIIQKKNESLLEISFINGSSIFFKSAEQKDSLRGYTITGILVLDEAVFLGDDILELCLPWVAVHKAPILIVSTPKFRQGFFYRYFVRGSAKGRIRSFDWQKYDLSRFLNDEQKQELRQLMTKNQYITEVEGEFLDDNCSVFEGFMNCVLQDSVPYRKLYVGIDFSNQTGNDNTVISALNENGQQCFLYYFNNKSTSEQLDFICNFLDEHRNNISCVVPELNSLGTPLTDMIKQRCGWANIQPHITSNNSKNDIISNLQMAFQKQEIGIMNDDEQLRELQFYAMEFLPKSNKVTYNAPQGMKDDICIALALSWKAYKYGSTSGYYNISFNK